MEPTRRDHGDCCPIGQCSPVNRSVRLGLFFAIPVLGFLMFLSMINTRFDIILYTRTVNGVRAYFAMRAEQIGVADSQTIPCAADRKERAPVLRVFSRLQLALLLDGSGKLGVRSYLLPEFSESRLVLLEAMGGNVKFPLVAHRRLHPLGRASY
jgi:hypothetical protein